MLGTGLPTHFEHWRKLSTRQPCEGNEHCRIRSFRKDIATGSRTARNLCSLLRSSSKDETNPNFPSYSSYHEDSSVVCMHASETAETNSEMHVLPQLTNPKNRDPNVHQRPTEGPTSTTQSRATMNMSGLRLPWSRFSISQQPDPCNAFSSSTASTSETAGPNIWRADIKNFWQD